MNNKLVAAKKGLLSQAVITKEIADQQVKLLQRGINEVITCNLENKFLNLSKAELKEIQFLLKPSHYHLNQYVSQKGSDPKKIETFQKMVDKKVEPQYWEIAKILGKIQNDKTSTQKQKDDSIFLITMIREMQGFKAELSQKATKVEFGTSGWRGKIGEDFTVLNVHKVARAIIEMMQTEEFLKENGYTSFKEVQEKGIVVFRDNRFMGDEFMEAAMKELAAEGIKIHFAGECPTGVGSALVTELGAAGSFNFTPSHNPMEFAGLKFNPADGGPAGPNLTKLIVKFANEFMEEGNSFEPANMLEIPKEIVNTKEIVKQYFEKNPKLNIENTRKWLLANKEKVNFVVDNMHGASRGYIEYILGDEVIEALRMTNSIKFLNTNDDYSFHGIAPEPSANNMVHVEEVMQQNIREYNFSVQLDPDGDRIRFGKDFDMNKFGPVAYANLLSRGFTGPIATTVASSSFGAVVAKANGQEFYEFKVGFKEFRPVHDKALIMFEESDGITINGGTREKCGIEGFFMALDTIITQNKSLDQYYKELQQKYGYYYAEKTGLKVPGVLDSEWGEYKPKILSALPQVFKVGQNMQIGLGYKTITNINTVDGVRLDFEDGSYILLRPSGTEAKMRLYAQLSSKEELHPNEIMHEKIKYFQAGEDFLAEALELVPR